MINEWLGVEVPRDIYASCRGDAAALSLCHFVQAATHCVHCACGISVCCSFCFAFHTSHKYLSFIGGGRRQDKTPLFEWQPLKSQVSESVLLALLSELSKSSSELEKGKLKWSGNYKSKCTPQKIVQWKGSNKTMDGRMGGCWVAVGSSWPLTPFLNGSCMPVTATHPLILCYYFTTLPYFANILPHHNGYILSWPLPSTGATCL